MINNFAKFANKPLIATDCIRVKYQQLKLQVRVWMKEKCFLRRLLVWSFKLNNIVGK